MTTILALETSTEACSIALQLPNETVELHEIIPRMHSQKILPMIDKLLVRCGISKTAIDVIAFGRGPGAFTGVRIAAAITQGIAYALDKPVASVSTLAALAQYAVRKENALNILVVQDARMEEVYWSCFSQNTKDKTVHALSKEYLNKPEKIDTSILQKHSQESWYGIGTGWSYENIIPIKVASINSNILPHAYDIATLANKLIVDKKLITADKAVPVYIRNNVAKKSSKIRTAN